MYICVGAVRGRVGGRKEGEGLDYRVWMNKANSNYAGLEATSHQITPSVLLSIQDL